MRDREVKGFLTLTLVTPTAQMVDGSHIRKMPFIFEGREGRFIRYIPFISGESLRGIARRRLGYRVMKEILRNGGGSFDAKLIHMFIDGGMTSSSGKLGYAREKELREKFPFLSVFGIGLSLHGKLIIQDAFPVVRNGDDPVTDGGEERKSERSEVYACYEESNIGNLIGIFNLYKRDDILSHNSEIFNFLTEEDIEKWEKEARERSKKRKEKEDKNKKVKEKNRGKGKKEDEDENEKKKKPLKGTTLGSYSVEYIIPGTRLQTEISVFEDEELTEAEKGCIILAAMEIVKARRIGAFQRKNWGLYDANLDLFVDGERVALSRGVDRGNLLRDSREPYMATVSLKLEDYIKTFWDTVGKTTVADVREAGSLTEQLTEEAEEEG